MTSTKFLLFSATWCQPCKQIKKTAEKLPEGYLVTYDIEKHEELAQEYAIRVVPTVVVLDSNGTETDRFVGNQPFSKFTSYL